jgi:hypothetical protein
MKCICIYALLLVSENPIQAGILKRYFKTPKGLSAPMNSNFIDIIVESETESFEI